MKSLFIEDNLEEKKEILLILKKYIQEEVITVSSIQEGIEFSENLDNKIGLIICDYHGHSQVLIKSSIGIRPNIDYIIITNKVQEIEALLDKKQEKNLSKVIDRSQGVIELGPILEKLQKKNKLSAVKILDSEFMKIHFNSFKTLKPLGVDLYIRLSEHKYLKLFKKDDSYEEEDLKKYLKKIKEDFFYLRNTEVKFLFEKHSRKMGSFLESKTFDLKESRNMIESNIDFIHEMIKKVGANEKVQELTKKTVTLTLKVIGNSPKLSGILKSMKRTGKGYMESHSLLLAEVACALACRVDWHSSTTFLKLSLAAFLHDITLQDDSLVHIKLLSELDKQSHLTEAQIQAYKRHPIEAANYAKEFREIPPDVDIIILEHHERPDGLGFPRKLHYRQIAPLSALFIIAHDLLNYLYFTGRAGSLSEYVSLRAEEYSKGSFKNIFKILQNEFL